MINYHEPGIFGNRLCRQQQLARRIDHGQGNLDNPARNFSIANRRICVFKISDPPIVPLPGRLYHPHLRP
jgi:hypothetical protein